MTTNHMLNRIMGNVFRTQTSPALPTNYYIGLSTSTPTAAGGNVTEPSGGGYARKQLTGLSAPTNGVITNNSAIAFNESTASWGTVTYFVIYDAATNGNLLFYDKLTSSRAVEANTVITIKEGALKLTLANP